jgi:hypothetical protein
VDLALFLRQNVESNVGQKPCSLEVLDGKLVLQQRVKKIKVIDNINLWTDAFLNFTMVLIENHPSKATELLRYMYIIRNIAKESPSSRWLLYDQQYRLRVLRNPTKRWASIDGELWLRFITTFVNSTINYTQRTSTFHCYDYSYKGSCNRLNCQYKHACIKCSLQHPSIHCVSYLARGIPNTTTRTQIKVTAYQNNQNLQRPSQMNRPRLPLSFR